MNRRAFLVVAAIAISIAAPAAASDNIARDMPDRDAVIATYPAAGREGCRRALYGDFIPKAGRADRAAYMACGRMYEARVLARTFPRGVEAYLRERPRPRTVNCLRTGDFVSCAID